MKKLTLEYIEQNKLTPIKCVKFFNPDWTNEECDYYLWSFTCFPMSTKVMIEQLNKAFAK